MSKIKANTIETLSGSDSHSVDTMGIVHGSNSNGNYVKYPDGTMEQYGVKTFTSISMTISIDGMFRNSASNGSIYLPLAFIGGIGDYSSSVNFGGSAFQGTVLVGVQQVEHETTQQIRVILIRNSSGTGTYTVTWRAIGRWK